MIKADKSLEEVWEMKEAAWKGFLDSGYSSYAKYINDSVKDIKIKYHIKDMVTTQKIESPI
jgi:hypothetical protein